MLPTTIQAGPLIANLDTKPGHMPAAGAGALPALLAVLAWQVKKVWHFSFLAVGARTRAALRCAAGVSVVPMGAPTPRHGRRSNARRPSSRYAENPRTSSVNTRLQPSSPPGATRVASA